MSAAEGTPDAEGALDAIIEGHLLEPLFQPIVDLDGLFVAGYEALARGPVGPLHAPDALFRTARACDRLVELDWLCRLQAVELARRAGLRHPISLFINAEPEALVQTAGDTGLWAQFGDLRCYAEVTERALTSHPAELLKAVDQVREDDWGVAVDDVGSNAATLALLPLLQPDVIKLDLSLLHARATHSADDASARVLHGVLAQAQATGAVLVAEGIETEEQLDLARAFGAHYGQGFLLGRPARLPAPLQSPSKAVPLVRRLLDRSVAPGAFAAVAGCLATRRMTRASLHELARQLLARALALDPAPTVLVCANDPELFDGELAALLEGLSGLPLVGLVGSRACAARLGTVPASELGDTDPARHDFDVTVISPHYAGAVVARPTLDAAGAYDAVLTFDRGLATSAASALARRLSQT